MFCYTFTSSLCEVYCFLTCLEVFSYYRGLCNRPPLRSHRVQANSCQQPHLSHRLHGRRLAGRSETSSYLSTTIRARPINQYFSGFTATVCCCVSVKSSDLGQSDMYLCQSTDPHGDQEAHGGGSIGSCTGRCNHSLCNPAQSSSLKAYLYFCVKPTL